MKDQLFVEKRQSMVEWQLKARGIRDKRVLKALGDLPRHLFVEESLMDRAYDDCALPIGEGQTISQPYMVAIMTELLELGGHEKVLEIGTGSGYQTALLSMLAKEVYSVERITVLSERADKVLRQLDCVNVHLSIANGTLGFPDEAPFDGIIVTAGSPEIPSQYVEQLKTDGRLVIPVGGRYSQVLYQVKKTPDGYIKTASTSCVFVPLIGTMGWQEDQVH